MEKFKTPGGKEIEVYHSGFSFKIRFVGGGELPEELGGIYTSFPDAKISILKYLAKKEAVVETPKQKK